eukprot:gene16145-biopygen23244
MKRERWNVGFCTPGCRSWEVPVLGVLTLGGCQRWRAALCIFGLRSLTAPGFAPSAGGTAQPPRRRPRRSRRRRRPRRSGCAPRPSPPRRSQTAGAATAAWGRRRRRRCRRHPRRPFSHEEPSAPRFVGIFGLAFRGWTPTPPCISKVRAALPGFDQSAPAQAEGETKANADPTPTGRGPHDRAQRHGRGPDAGTAVSPIRGTAGRGRCTARGGNGAMRRRRHAGWAGGAGGGGCRSPRPPFCQLLLRLGAAAPHAAGDTGRNGHSRVRNASVSLNSIVRPAPGPRLLPFLPGARGTRPRPALRRHGAHSFGDGGGAPKVLFERKAATRARHASGTRPLTRFSGVWGARLACARRRFSLLSSLRGVECASPGAVCVTRNAAGALSIHSYSP